MEEKIIFLYPQSSTQVYQKLQKILQAFGSSLKASNGKAKRATFTEKDAVLITYADHVSEKGQKTLQTMRKFLDTFAKDLFNKIHFLPFYPYSSDDGFSVIDYYTIKDEFGTWQDIETIHKDFLLMFDFVANHVSSQSEWFEKFLQGDDHYANYFVAYDEPIDTSLVYRPRTTPLLTHYKTKQGEKYIWTTFSEDQIDLQWNNPEVFLELTKILLFYITQGADTVRLDAVNYLWKDPKTSSVNLPQTHMLVKIFRQILEEYAPHVWLIPESNTRQTINASYFGNGQDEAHLIYNFTLAPLLLYSFIEEDSTKLSSWVSSLVYPKHATFFNVTATHDGIGLQPVKDILTEEEIQKLIAYVVSNGCKISYHTVSGGTKEPYEINGVYKSVLGNDEKFLASQAIQLALRGVPGIYLNSFIGEENWEEGVTLHNANRAINRRKFAYQILKTELTDSLSAKYKIYAAYQHLLTLRQNEPLFSPHVHQEVVLIDPHIFALKRIKGNTSLLALTNMSHRVLPLHNLSHIMQKSIGTDILTQRLVDLTRVFMLQPYQTLWLKSS
ncbi:MAG TPA: alpha-amylase family glycosyl hydrolase [Methylomirabilota bacterium]|nr:alpha-amylase family glycosyl hydrolase [Methylomirabilota bacterium]